MKFRLFLLLACLVWKTPGYPAEVSVERVPAAGLQPQCLVSADGSIHLIQLEGDPKACDIIHRSRTQTGSWSLPVRVNSQPGSAIAIGTIRGARMAAGMNGKLHVVWNGSGSAIPRHGPSEAPLLHARQETPGGHWSAQRNLMRNTHQLDGGASIAAAGDGKVFVFLQASPQGLQGETNRAAYLIRSMNDGIDFTDEEQISPAGGGACGCCGVAGFLSSEGEPGMLFRNARTQTQRDMMLLLKGGSATSFQAIMSDPWKLAMCPMSSAALLASPLMNWAAWESEGGIRLLGFKPGRSETHSLRVGPVKGAKHPALAINAKGEILVLWTEGTGWDRGGSIAWQRLSPEGKLEGDPGRASQLPAWSFGTAYARTDGNFVILY